MIVDCEFGVYGNKFLAANTSHRGWVYTQVGNFGGDIWCDGDRCGVNGDSMLADPPQTITLNWPDFHNQFF
jgi:hypothetical protein